MWFILDIIAYCTGTYLGDRFPLIRKIAAGFGFIFFGGIAISTTVVIGQFLLEGILFEDQQWFLLILAGICWAAAWLCVYRFLEKIKK